jgi:hypothetical protein
LADHLFVASPRFSGLDRSWETASGWNAGFVPTSLSKNFRRHSVDSPCQGLGFLLNTQISLFTHVGAVGVAKMSVF